MQDASLDALCAMFGSLDREVVSVVLESNGGDADRAIDQLLLVAQDADAGAKEGATTAATGSSTPEPASALSLAQSPATESSSAPAPAPAPALAPAPTPEPPATSTPEPPAPTWRKALPEDFLRLPAGLAAARRAQDQHQDQIRRDELLAHMLSDEGFRSELARHADLSAAASAAAGSGAGTSGHGAGAGAGAAEAGLDWAGAWEELSEAAKTKFEALATRFQRVQGAHDSEYASLSSSDKND